MSYTNYPVYSIKPYFPHWADLFLAHPISLYHDLNLWRLTKGQTTTARAGFFYFVTYLFRRSAVKRNRFAKLEVLPSLSQIKPTLNDADIRSVWFTPVETTQVHIRPSEKSTPCFDTENNECRDSEKREILNASFLSHFLYILYYKIM